MGTRIHLYALPGLPLHVEDLMPQPLLARCAGSLYAQGHAVGVFDTGSIKHLESCGAAELPAPLLETGEAATRSRKRWTSAFDGSVRRHARLLADFQHRRIADAMATPDGGGPQSLAVIQIQRRKDVSGARQLAQSLKQRNPLLRVVVAGDIVARYARPLLVGAPEFDLACLGPAEAVVTGLARSLGDPESWTRIPGLVCRRDGRLAACTARAIPLHPSFALPDYHPARYPAMMDSGKIKLFTLTQSSGLSHVGHYRGDCEVGAVQVRETRHLRAEVEQIHELYGAKAFHIAGEDTPSESIQQFAGECRSLPFEIRYSRDASVREIRAEHLPALALSGCQALRFSLLTGSQHLLADFYGEDWTISQVEASLRKCKAIGLYLHAEFVYPCPEDDYHSRAETFRVIRRCQPGSVRFRLPEMAPGSAWYQHAREFGYGVALHQLERWITAASVAACPVREAAEIPFQIGGQRGKPLARMIEGTLSELEEIGMPHASSVAAGLMARVAGAEGGEAEYGAALEESLLRLDMPQLHDTIDFFNMRATASIDTVDLFRPLSIKRAVGN